MDSDESHFNVSFITVRSKVARQCPQTRERDDRDTETDREDRGRQTDRDTQRESERDRQRHRERE